MYDAIVVGARCGGAPVAMLLAREGHRVLLVDRAEFPSDTMSTHAVKKPGVAALNRWGLLDEVVATGCPPITCMTFDLGELRLVGEAPNPEGATATYAPRRTVLDKILVDAAVKAGAEVREAYTVTDLLFEDGAVAGVRGHERGGHDADEDATIVIGADGRHSLVARTVGAPSYNERPPLSCWTYTYFADVDVPGAEFYPRGDRMVLAFPTNDGLVLVAESVHISREEEIRAAVEDSFWSTLRLAAPLHERVRAGRREGRFVTTTDVPNFLRRPYGPGWALVGDAGCHKDPIVAEGISNAFRDAEFVAAAVHAGLTGAAPMQDALADYERTRNEATLPMYELSCLLGSMEPLPEPVMAKIASLPGNQPAINAFFGVIEGTVPVSAIMT